MKIDYSEAMKLEVIGWLQTCRDLLVEKRPLSANPFYERTELLTPEVVHRVIGHIKETYARELKSYASYHRSRNGMVDGQTLVAPRFDEQPYEVQLAIVQGLDRIYQRYKAPEPEEVKPPDLEGPPYIDYTV